MKKIMSTREMLNFARIGKYAVPAFNVHNLETVQAVIEVANDLKSPVILAVTPETVKYAGPEYLLSIVETASKKCDIPIALHLDHFKDVDSIKNLIDMGFKSIMIDASDKSFNENIAVVREVVNYAHKHNVTVEAELGRVGGREENITVNESEKMLTDPEEAEIFVSKTGVDSLAVAIGTAHGVYKVEPKLDFNRLGRISERVKIPLVLHGASGVSNEDIKKAIQLGICKINIATDLKISFTKAVREYLLKHPDTTDLRQYLEAGKEAVKKVVEAKIKICGSDNKTI